MTPRIRPTRPRLPLSQGWRHCCGRGGRGWGGVCTASGTALLGPQAGKTVEKRRVCCSCPPTWSRRRRTVRNSSRVQPDSAVARAHSAAVGAKGGGLGRSPRRPGCKFHVRAAGQGRRRGFRSAGCEVPDYRVVEDPLPLPVTTPRMLVLERGLWLPALVNRA